MDYRILNLRSKVEENKRKIAQGEANNELYQNLKDDLADVKGKQEYFTQKIEQMGSALSTATVVMSMYRRRAVQILQEEIKNLLDMVFPDEDFIPLIDYSSRNNNPMAELLIGKYSPVENKVVYGHPANTNGGMVKQLIVAAATAAINVLTGSPIIMFDEAFCSGDSKSQAELQQFLNSLVSRGVQIIMIEHSSEMMDGLPRWEINLMKHRSSEEARIISSEMKDIPSNFAEILKKMNAVQNVTAQTFAIAADAYSEAARASSVAADMLEAKHDGEIDLEDLFAPDNVAEPARTVMASEVGEISRALLESVEVESVTEDLGGADISGEAGAVSASDGAIGDVSMSDTDSVSNLDIELDGLDSMFEI